MMLAYLIMAAACCVNVAATIFTEGDRKRDGERVSIFCMTVAIFMLLHYKK